MWEKHGTDGTCPIVAVPEESESIPFITVSLSRSTVEAFPAKIVALPVATAVMIGGSSVDRVATAVSLEVHVGPVTDWLLARQ